jgi:hypothetical protein
MPARDCWINELMASQRPYCPCEEMDSEDTLFVLYTSGSTGICYINVIMFRCNDIAILFTAVRCIDYYTLYWCIDIQTLSILCNTVHLYYLANKYYLLQSNDYIVTGQPKGLSHTTAGYLLHTVYNTHNYYIVSDSAVALYCN